MATLKKGGAALTAQDKSDFVAGLGLSQVVTVDPVTGAASIVGGGSSLATPKSMHIEEFGASVGGYWDSAFAAAMAHATEVGGLVIKLQSQQTYKLYGTMPTPVLNANNQMVPIAIVGAGSYWSGRDREVYGSTVLDITGAAAYGKIALNGFGLFAIRDLTLMDSVGTSGALLYTTNTTVHVKGVTFAHKDALVHGTKTQDAIVLGGPNQVEGGIGWTDGFQGYGSIVEGCHFHGSRRAVKLGAFANNIIVRDNNVWRTCGDADGAPFEIDCGTGAQNAVGNTFTGNLIEVSYYKHGYMLAKASRNHISGGGFYDETATTVSCIGFPGNSANNNYFNIGFHSDGLPAFDTSELLSNFVIDSANTDGVCYFAQKTRLKNPSIPRTGNLTFETAAGLTNAEFQSGGAVWKSTKNGDGESMSIDTGTGGSYLDVKAYGIRFFSHTGTKFGEILSTAAGATFRQPLTWKPVADQTPVSNGDLTFDAPSNTSVRVKFKGSDGVVRSATLTLA